MKYTYMIIGIVVIVMLVVVSVFVVTGNNDGVWDTPWETDDDDGSMAGIWGEEIIIEYEDGSTQSLKMLEENLFSINPFSVKYDGKKITSARYNVYATATGEEFTGCEIEEFTVNTRYFTGTGLDIIPFKGPFESYIRPGVISLGSQIQIINIGTNVNATLSGETPGIYSVGWAIVNENIRYRGVPDGEWQTVERPPGRAISVSVETGSIYLELESGFGTS